MYRPHTNQVFPSLARSTPPSLSAHLSLQDTNHECCERLRIAQKTTITNSLSFMLHMVERAATKF